MKERLNWWWFFFCVCIVLPALQFFFLKESLPVVLFPFIQDKFINGLYPFLASGASVVLLLLIVLFFKSISKYIKEAKIYKLIYIISGVMFALFYVNQFVRFFREAIDGAPRRYSNFSKGNLDEGAIYLSIIMCLELAIFITFFVINFSRLSKHKS